MNYKGKPHYYNLQELLIEYFIFTLNLDFYDFYLVNLCAVVLVSLFQSIYLSQVPFDKKKSLRV